VQNGGVSGFRFPDGVDYLGEDDDGMVRFNVSIPVDEDGYFGRECAACEQHFRIQHEDYDRLPDDQRLWCVYCGHVDDHSEYMTKQQAERVMRAAGDYAEQLIGQMLDDALGGMASQSRGSMISFSYRSTPFYPEPLPGIDEEKLVRERSCEACALRYAVFGEHRFCPICGLLSPLTTALDALDAESLRLKVLKGLSDDTFAALRESGVLQRTWVDTIENVVGVVEVLADAVFRSNVTNAEVILKGKGKVFQRLADLADLFDVHLGSDLRSALGTAWPILLQTWAARHVFTHRDGIVDAKYLGSVPQSLLRAGQRLQIREGDAAQAIEKARDLCVAIAAAAPA
jgi:hypothetical protein